MKLTCKQRDLLVAVNTVMPAVEARRFAFGADGISLTVEPGTLRLAASGSDTLIETKIAAAAEGEGTLRLQARVLRDVVRGLGSDEPVVIESNGQKATLSWKKCRFEIQPLSSGSDAAAMWDVEGTTVELGASSFFEEISRVAFCAARPNSGRPMLEGVCLSGKEDVLEAVAIDGVRLAKVDMPPMGVTGRWVVSAEALKTASRAFRGDEKIALTFSERAVRFADGKTRIATRLLEGCFPQYERIIPAPTKTVFTAKVPDLSAAVERIAIVAEAKEPAVFLKPAGERLRVFSRSAEGNATEDVAVKLEGLEMTVAVNGDLFSEILRGIAGEGVTVAFDSPTTPLLIRGAGCNDWVAVLMPLMTAEARAKAA